MIAIQNLDSLNIKMIYYSSYIVSSRSELVLKEASFVLGVV